MGSLVPTHTGCNQVAWNLVTLPGLLHGHSTYLHYGSTGISGIKCVESFRNFGTPRRWVSRWERGRRKRRRDAHKAVSIVEMSRRAADHLVSLQLYSTMYIVVLNSDTCSATTSRN